MSKKFMEKNYGQHANPMYNYYDSSWHADLKETDVQTIQSVTKSIISALFGIAIDIGFIASIDQEIVFKKFGAIPVDRKKNSGQYDSVVKELIQRDNFLLIITPEGRFDATRFRSSFLYLAKELEAEVMPVQIDYENHKLQFLNSLDLEGSEEEVIQRLRLCFDGIKGKKNRFKA